MNTLKSLVAASVSETLKAQLQAYDDICGFYFADSTENTFLLLVKNRFDLIFVERTLVTEDLLASIKILSPNTPLIVLIEHDSQTERKQLISTGFDDCLLQPVTAENVISTVSFWLTGDELEMLSASIRSLLAKFNQNQPVVAKLWLGLFAELPVQLNQVATAMQSRDFVLVYDIVHKINGSAKVCLLQEIGTIATRIEEALKDQDYGQVESDFQILNRKILQLLTRRDYILKQLAPN